jgi:hypothetical protein
MAKIVKISGTEYRLYTSQTGRFYYGCWTDMDSGEVGGSSTPRTSEAQALADAKGNAAVSHPRRHPENDAA